MDYLSQLPPEVVRLIVKNLSYAEMQRVRSSCAALDEACASLLSTALHELRMRSGRTVERFIAAPWLRTEHHTERVRQMYDKRVRLGAASLLVLETMVRVADSGSFTFLRKNILPPFPGEFLDEIRKAISLATRRNPLVGRERLRTIYGGLLMYFYRSRIPTTSSILLVFHTIVDLLDCFPAPPWWVTHRKDAKSASVLFHREIDPVATFGQRLHVGKAYSLLAINSIITSTIIMFLYNLPHADVVYDDGYIPNENPYLNIFEVTSMSLDVTSDAQETAAVNCLRDLPQLEPRSFSVKLSQIDPNHTNLDVFGSYSKTICFNFHTTPTTRKVESSQD